MQLEVLCEIDHRNKLDNRRSNLRRATKQQQKGNEGLRRDNISGFRGVSRYKSTGKWRSQICINGKVTHLGLFLTKIEAAKAYNKCAIQVFGKFAWLNPI
jgi:hypothetical protein